MYKYLFPIFVAGLLVSSNAEAFLDIFATYGKRHMDIRKTFIDALETSEKKWKQDGVTCPDNEQMFFAFSPLDQTAENWEERFTYYEFGLGLKVDSLDYLYRNYFSEKQKSAHSKEDICLQNDNEICFEAYYTGQAKLTTGARHMLVKIIKVNDPKKKFIAYRYQVKNRNISDEEKDFWFQMFDYARIDF